MMVVYWDLLVTVGWLYKSNNLLLWAWNLVDSFKKHFFRNLNSWNLLPNITYMSHDMYITVTYIPWLLKVWFKDDHDHESTTQSC